jgi:pimeloyl-ACP methyl ester carboxylesterase
MPYLSRDGVKLYYSTYGSPNSPPVILTHGYSSTSSMWDGQITPLSEHFHLILWDMRGHGQSDYPEDQSLYSEDHTVRDIAAILNHVVGAGTKVIVGGLSLGGYMSLAFYRVFPKRVRALLIIDTGPGFKKDSAREVWNLTANKTADSFERNGLSQLKILSAERSRVTHRNSKGLALAARGMLAQRNASVINSLADIKVPSLVVVGSEDKPYLAASEYMSKKIPRCSKVVVSGAGHAVNIDQPEGFLRGIMPFLENVLMDGKAKL